MFFIPQLHFIYFKYLFCFLFLGFFFVFLTVRSWLINAVLLPM